MVVGTKKEDDNHEEGSEGKNSNPKNNSNFDDHSDDTTEATAVNTIAQDLDEDDLLTARDVVNKFSLGGFQGNFTF